MKWLRSLYDRRVVNVNVNVVTAGILAMGITVGVIHLSNWLGAINWLDSKLPVSRAFILNLITFGVDLVADVAVYYLLHWVANHMPRNTPRIVSGAYGDMSFVRDATLVQFERAVLSPLLYLIALGTQHYMVHHGYGDEVSTLVGFTFGIATSRVLHTMWMLRQEKKAEEKRKREENAKASESPSVPEPKDRGVKGVTAGAS